MVRVNVSNFAVVFVVWCSVSFVMSADADTLCLKFALSEFKTSPLGKGRKLFIRYKMYSLVIYAGHWLILALFVHW
jgi:hypothetical protein